MSTAPTGTSSPRSRRSSPPSRSAIGAPRLWMPTGRKGVPARRPSAMRRAIESSISASPRASVRRDSRSFMSLLFGWHVDVASLGPDRSSAPGALQAAPPARVCGARRLSSRQAAKRLGWGHHGLDPAGERPRDEDHSGQPRGFCAGVNMAIESLERALEFFGAPLYVYHEIVHNKYVVERFLRRGTVFVESLDQVPEG